MAAQAKPVLKPYPYPFRAQISGTFRFMCPRCGFIATKKLHYGSYRWNCTNTECKARWVIGLSLRPGKVGNPNRTDVDPTDHVFPSCDIAPYPWRAGDPVHIVYDADGNVVPHCDPRPRSAPSVSESCARARAARLGMARRKAAQHNDDDPDATPQRTKQRRSRRKRTAAAPPASPE